MRERLSPRATRGGRSDALAPSLRRVTSSIMTASKTPAELGYRMPAEWEPHRGTWLSWPHKEASWPGKFGPVPGIFATMVRHLADHEEVHINVAGPELEQDVRRLLADAGADSGNVFFHYHPTNDAWARDHGPIFVQREDTGAAGQAIIDWKF